MGKYKEALMGGKGADILADVKNHKEFVANQKQVEKDYEFDADDRNFHEAQDAEMERMFEERPEHDPIEPR